MDASLNLAGSIHFVLDWSLSIVRTSVYCNYFIEQISRIFFQRISKLNKLFNTDPIFSVFYIVKMSK